MATNKNTCLQNIDDVYSECKVSDDVKTKSDMPSIFEALSNELSRDSDDIDGEVTENRDETVLSSSELLQSTSSKVATAKANVSTKEEQTVLFKENTDIHKQSVNNVALIKVIEETVITNPEHFETKASSDFPNSEQSKIGITFLGNDNNTESDVHLADENKLIPTNSVDRKEHPTNNTKQDNDLTSDHSLNIIQVKNILLVQYNNVYEHFPNTKRAVKGQIPKPFTFHKKDGNKVLVCFLNGTLFMILYICTMFTLQ